MNNPLISMIETANVRQLANIKKSLGIGVNPDCTIDFYGVGIDSTCDDWCIDFDGLVVYGETEKQALVELVNRLDDGCGEYTNMAEAS